MFDYVTVPPGIKCPRCGQDMGEVNWQSKSGACELTRVEYHEVDRFYQICQNKECGEWVEFNRIKGNVEEVPGYEMKHFKKGERHGGA